MDKNEINKQKTGVCPNCDSLMIYYEVFEFQDNGGYYPFSCNSCGYAGKEWYNLIFVEQTKDEHGHF